MNISEFQIWLNKHGANIKVDGIAGINTQTAILQVFVNKNPAKLTPANIDAYAKMLTCAPQQVMAISQVESGGNGFDKAGRPVILWERHKFWARTKGIFGVTWFSNKLSGGYSTDENKNAINDSWEKLVLAACKDPLKAFESCSWGRFQIMGYHANDLGYANALEMAYSMTRSEANHYDALVRFLFANRLTDAVRALSSDPKTCVAFAQGYNGKGYRQNSYHEKLAAAMRAQA